MEGYWSLHCVQCGAAYLDDTPQCFIDKCCTGKGVNKIPDLRRMMSALQDQYDNKESNAHLMDVALQYNQRLAMAATGVRNDHGGGFQPLGPNASLTVQGQMYHFLKKDHSNNISTIFGHIFFATSPDGNDDLIDDGILKFLFNCMKLENAIAATMSSVFEMLRNNPNGDNQQQVNVTINGSASTLDISILRNDVTSVRVLHCFRRDQAGKAETIALNTGLSEPMMYPLLLTKGEKGWDRDMGINKKIYIAARYMRCEKDMIMPSLLYPQYMLPINRFQWMARLGQLWLLDVVSAMMDNQITYYKQNQKKFKGRDDEGNGGEGEEEKEDYEENDIDVPEAGAGRQGTFLPKAATGSPRHMKVLALNSLHVVSQLGTPTHFITLTTNVKWPEILERLLPGQTAFNRPDIVCQVLINQSINHSLSFLPSFLTSHPDSTVSSSSFLQSINESGFYNEATTLFSESARRGISQWQDC